RGPPGHDRVPPLTPFRCASRIPTRAIHSSLRGRERRWSMITESHGEGDVMDLQLEGKRAIVTGGSRGIGKAVARALANEGVDVALVARSAEPLQAAANELAELTGRHILAVA